MRYPRTSVIQDLNILLQISILDHIVSRLEYYITILQYCATERIPASLTADDVIFPILLSDTIAKKNFQAYLKKKLINPFGFFNDLEPTFQLIMPINYS